LVEAQSTRSTYLKVGVAELAPVLLVEAALEAVGRQLSGETGKLVVAKILKTNLVEKITQKI